MEKGRKGEGRSPWPLRQLKAPPSGGRARQQQEPATVGKAAQQQQQQQEEEEEGWGVARVWPSRPVAARRRLQSETTSASSAVSAAPTVKSCSCLPFKCQTQCTATLQCAGSLS
jgi:hypothetical protein